MHRAPIEDSASAAIKRHSTCVSGTFIQYSIIVLDPGSVCPMHELLWDSPPRHSLLTQNLIPTVDCRLPIFIEPLARLDYCERQIENPLLLFSLHYDS